MKSRYLPSRQGVLGAVGAMTLGVAVAACNDVDQVEEGAVPGGVATTERPTVAGLVNDPHRITFDRFAVVGVPTAGGDAFTIRLVYNDRNVDDPSRMYVSYSPGSVWDAFPTATCRSRKIEAFTGGANCCFNYYILSACDGVDYAAAVYSDAPATVGEPQSLRADGSLKGLGVDDPSFLYYEPTDQSSGDGFLSLSGADSPRLTRHMVFDNGRWRMDRPGEFPEVYEKLRSDAQPSSDPTVAQAISMAYYAVMAGLDPVSVQPKLADSLPGRYRSLAPAIMDDIRRATISYNPISNLDVTP